jgi:hypothetical protein
MKLFLKANSASIIASSADYLAALVLNKVFLCQPFWSSATGTVVGGMVNFLICRHWVFGRQGISAGKSALRYVLVWAGNMLLNMVGVYWLLHLGLTMLPAKILTSLIVAVAYNYPLQKLYVFTSK